MSTPEMLLAKLAETITHQCRHADYARTMDVRKFCMQMMGAESQRDILRRFRRFEDDDLMEQRERLTNTMTRTVLSRPRKYWRKVKRVDGISFRVTPPTTASANALAEMSDAFGDFADNMPIFDYLVEKMESLGVTDPNAWIIYEREDTRDGTGRIVGTRTYPYVVGCENALDFSCDCGRMEWLTVAARRMFTQVGKNKTAQKWLTDYFVYGEGLTVRARDMEGATPEDGEVEMAFPNVREKYLVKVFETGFPHVPAHRTGCYPDIETAGRTFVSWFEDAREALLDLIRDKSFLDVTKAVHVYTKRYEYVKECDYSDTESGGCCERGWITDRRGGERHECPACGGSGLKANFTTEQQAIQLRMPNKADSLLELSKLYHNEAPPIELPQFLRTEIDLTEAKVMLTVINPGLLEQATGAADQTATQKNYDYEDLYDRLEPFAAAVSRHMVLAHQAGAAYLDITSGADVLAVHHQFPKDFKMETLAKAISNLEAAKTSGAGYEIIAVLRRRVWEKMYEDSPETVSAIEARYRWMPFDDKGADEVAQIMAMRDITDPQRVLWENHADIFRDIEAATGDGTKFHQLPEAKQRALVNGRVAEYAAAIVEAGGAAFAQPEPQ